MLSQIFQRLRHTAAPSQGADSGPACTVGDSRPPSMGIDEILERSQMLAGENEQLAARVRELEASASAAPDVAGLEARLKAALDTADQMTAQRDVARAEGEKLKAEATALHQQVVAITADRDGWKEKHQRLVLGFELKVAQKVAELGIRGTPLTDPTPETPKAAIPVVDGLPAPGTGRARMEAAYLKQLQGDR